jgi:CTP synthase
VDVDITWVEASDLEPTSDTSEEATSAYTKAWEALHSADGICVPGGFGNRGTEGKILACQYARENKKPYLGLCLGMQVMVMEYARNVLEWRDANSTEFNPDCKHPVIIFMPEVNKNMMGGTMRLGARATVIRDHCIHKDQASTKTIASVVYGTSEPLDGALPAPVGSASDVVVERHRHRYEVNPEKVPTIEAAGLVFSGKDETGERMEICELPRDQHPFFFGTQFHPEFKSRPNRPSPPFFGFLSVCAGKEDKIGLGGQVSNSS